MSLVLKDKTGDTVSIKQGLQQSVAPVPPLAVSVHPAPQRQSHLALLSVHLLVATEGPGLGRNV